MEQVVINEGTEIFESIQTELRNATKEIIVVSAWFTDEKLLNTLVDKAEQGIRVRVAIADKKDNDKLDFNKLLEKGGFVNRVKQRGYGMLHDKYCIVDGKIAFHGSYNWTNNAKKNNKESVIKTNHNKTIDQLIKQFEMLSNTEGTIPQEEKGISKLMGKIFKNNKIEKDKVIDKNIVDNSHENQDDSVDEIFKSIISAEIKKTNRSDIKSTAYDQAKEVSGDPQVITKSMDSLYHLFVSDKNENDTNKEILIKKIDDKVIELSQNIVTQRDNELNSIEVEFSSIEKDLNLQKTNIVGKKELLQKEKNLIVENKIHGLEKKIESKNNAISSSDIEFVKPRFKWHEFIPLSLLFIGLSIAMILFYSSSAYIMLYAHEDAMINIKNGLDVNPQVFEAGAIRKSFSKDLTAGLYILFFVFIPFAIAYVAHIPSVDITNNFKKYGKKAFAYLVVIAIDAFIAVKVTQTISEIKYLTTGIQSGEHFYSDINFWLVFFLGAIPFFFLAELMTKLINIFGDRSEQTGREKMLLERKIYLNEINGNEKEISKLNQRADILVNDIQSYDNQVLDLDQKLIYLPKELNLSQKQINEQANNNIASLEKKADVYKNNIENDNIQISLSSLKDRVSAFIEGWSEWLHDEFSVTKAVKMSEEAIKESDLWIEQNLKNLS